MSKKFAFTFLAVTQFIWGALASTYYCSLGEISPGNYSFKSYVQVIERHTKTIVISGFITSLLATGAALTLVARDRNQPLPDK